MLSRFARLAAHIGHARTRSMIVAGGLFIGLILAAAMSWFILSSRQAVVYDSVREMHNDAMLLAEQEDRLLQSVDLIHISVIAHMRELNVDSADAFAQFGATAAMQHYLSERVAGLGYIAALMVFDANGKLLNSSHSWPPPDIDDTDRYYVRAQMAAWLPQPFLAGPAISKATGKWTMYISRRFDGSDGRLAGILVGAIPLDYFEQFYSLLPLTGGGAYVLYRRDGTLMARYPQVAGKVGQNYRTTPDFNRLVAALDGSTLRLVSMMDGQDRLLVAHAMEHFPLVVVVSDTVHSIFAAGNEEARILIVTTALLELVLGATVLLAVRHLWSSEQLYSAETAKAHAEAELAIAVERDRAAAVLHEQAQRFDVALNNMVQGVAMFDRDDRLLIVNRRAYQMFRVPDGAWQAGMSYEDMTNKLTEAGILSPDDVQGIRERRAALIARGEHATAIWETADGTAYNVTHQPMQDGWLTTYEDITERRHAEARMVHLAHHDTLTDLPNRVLFHQKLEEALAFIRRGYRLALLCLDLDQFKAVNDTLGHPIGDKLLQEVARRLAGGIRDIDMVARLGGDEFAIIQNAIARPAEAMGFATRLLDMLSKPFQIDDHQIVIGTSIGIAFAPEDGTDPDQLLRCADMALYRAKLDGRGVFRLFHADMDAQMQARRQLELDLRGALRTGQFELMYQPLVDLRAKAATGVEALLRWRHPERGLVSPDQFIPLAEEIGLIVPIGEWVLREACTTVASWPGAMRVAVNLSAVQFKNRNVVLAVSQALQESGLTPDRLELEITETVMLQDTDTTLATLHQLRKLGVHIAMDDFGTGYSSLSYLRRFPFDRIKIDQSFVRELSSKRDCGAIVRAVTGLSRELGMATTAEGVETQQQLEMLLRAGCTEFQGYLFSPAVARDRVVPTAAAIADMLRQPQEHTPAQAAA